MPLAHNTVSPAAFANALATVDATHASACNPAIIGGAWATLKQARGQSINFDVLAVPAHLILATPSAPAQPLPGRPVVVEDIQTIRDRADARARRHALIMGYIIPGHGGDAA